LLLYNVTFTNISFVYGNYFRMLEQNICKYRLLLIGNPGYLSRNLFPVQLLLDSTCPDLYLINPLLVYSGADRVKAACLEYLPCSQSVPLAEIYIAICQIG
jgi:hypothetical protein